MAYITYSQVDRQFRCLEKDLLDGLPFNRVDPLEGITFSFALESQYPLTNKEPAIYFGTIEEVVQDDPKILLRNISEEEFRRFEQQEIDFFSIKRTDIDKERDRRMDIGFIFKGTHFQSRAVDRENILGAAQLAHMAITLGKKVPNDPRWHDGEQDFTWIAADNSLVKMDAITVIQFGQKAAAHKSAHTFAARELKNMEALPEDYKDDKYWPVEDIPETQG